MTSLALYNPHLLSKQEILGLFTARTALLGRLVDDLRKTSSEQAVPTHHLLIGQRGMGKTTLLRRLQYAIEDDPVLSTGWLALAFPEEQYNISNLDDFWSNCLDALGDSLERIDRRAEALALDNKIESIRDRSAELGFGNPFDLLVSSARSLGKRLVLLVDNADMVLDRIKQEEWALREVLSTEASISFIGASAAALESTYNYGSAFYDFFQIHELSGLSLSETQDFLLHYSQVLGDPDVGRVARDDMPRLRTLHSLTGGNPRTVVLLYGVLARGIGGDVRSDLEQLLDQSTPLYKSRLEALPVQAQQVVHGLAVNWNPISAGELAEQLGLEVNVVSSQLNRLVRQGVVEKVAYEPVSKTGFQIGERFFNIWYLMRASRRVRRRLVWLVEFLRMFYDQDQLRAHAIEQLKLMGQLPLDRGLHQIEYGFALAGALDACSLRRALEHSSVRLLLHGDQFRRHIEDLIDLKGDDAGLRSHVERVQSISRVRGRCVKVLQTLRVVEPDILCERLMSAPLLSLKEKRGLVASLAKGEISVKDIEMRLRETEFFADVLLACAETVEALRLATRDGYMISPDDVAGAEVASQALGVRALLPVAIAFRAVGKQSQRLLEKLESMLGETTSPYPWLNWFAGKKDLSREAAGKVFPEVFGICSVSPVALIMLGQSAFDRFALAVEAEQAFRKVIELEPGGASGFLMLADLLHSLGRYEESGDVARQGLLVAPQSVDLLNALAELLCWHLNDPVEAEDLCGQAVSLAPNSARAWFLYGSVLHSRKKFDASVRALRKGLEIHDKNSKSWEELGQLLAYHMHDDAGAEEAYRRAIECASRPTDVERAYEGLALVLERSGRHQEAEEVLRRAVSENVKSCGVFRGLGDQLLRGGRLEEARDAYMKAVAAANNEASSLNAIAWSLYKGKFCLELAEKLAVQAVRARPKSPESRHTLAVVLLVRGKWPEATENAKLFISETDSEWQAEFWSDILLFFREAVRAGRAPDAAKFLDDIGMSDRWKPLREALEAASRNSDSYFKRVAPEVRRPAEEIFRDLMAQG